MVITCDGSTTSSAQAFTLYIDSFDNLFIAYNNTPTMDIFNTTSFTKITSVSSTTGSVSGVAWGFTTDFSNNLYVSYTDGNVYKMTNSTVSQLSISATNPKGIGNTIDYMYAVTGNSIAKYNNTGTLVSYTPTFTPPLNNPIGISFNSTNNTLYVVNNGSNNISSTTTL